MINESIAKGYKKFPYFILKKKIKVDFYFKKSLKFFFMKRKKFYKLACKSFVHEQLYLEKSDCSNLFKSIKITVTLVL